MFDSPTEAPIQVLRTACSRCKTLFPMGHWVLLAFLLLATGCSPSPEADSSNGPAQRPPTQVVAVAAKVEAVADTLSLIGSLAADETVALQSETAGVIERIAFEEGQQVEMGQPRTGTTGRQRVDSPAMLFAFLTNRGRCFQRDVEQACRRATIDGRTPSYSSGGLLVVFHPLTTPARQRRRRRGGASACGSACSASRVTLSLTLTITLTLTLT